MVPGHRDERGQPSGALSGRVAALIVRSPERLTQGDKVLQARLSRLGFSVRLLGQGLSEVRQQTWNVDLVLVSPSSELTLNDGLSLLGLQRPTVAVGVGAISSLALEDSGEGCERPEEVPPQIDIPLSVHPLAAGLVGHVRLAPGARGATPARPAKGAIAVGYPIVPGKEKAVLFGFEAVADAANPSRLPRRAALALTDDALGQLTEDGVRLLDAAIGWAAKVNLAPWVDVGPAPRAFASQPVPLGARVSDDGLPGGTLLTARWSVVAGPAKVDFDDETQPKSNVLFEAPGTYVLRLTATDGALASARDLAVSVGAPQAPEQARGAGEEAPETVADVLLVVSDPANLTAGDSEVRSRILAASLTVEVKAASAAVAGDAVGRKFVYLANSSPNLSLLEKFRDAPVPVVVTSVGIYDDMGLTEYANRGNASGAQLEVTAPGHQVASGLPNTLTSNTSSANYGWGIPTAGGTLVLRLPLASDPSGTKGPVFAYEQGSPMAGLPAPATRLALGLDTGNLTPDGRRLLDNAIAWLSGQNLPPRVDAGPDQVVTLQTAPNETPVLLHGTFSDDSDPVLWHKSWSLVSGPAPVTFTPSPLEADTTALLPAAAPRGSYVFRFTVTDGSFEASDEMVVLARQPSANQPPYVSAGFDTVVTYPGVANLSGVVVDDAPALVTVAWQKVTGPGTVAFGSPTSAATTATFGAYGTYVLRLLAIDNGPGGPYQASDEVVVGVKANGLLVVGNGGDLTAGDLVIKESLERVGVAVTPITAAAATTASANGRHLVFLASSAPNSDVCPNPQPCKFLNVAAPVIVMNGGIFGDMGLATTENQAPATTAYVAAPAHPIASGLSGGWSTVLSQPAFVFWGTPNANAATVVTLNQQQTQPTIFAYPQVAGGRGRRVAFGIAADPALSNGTSVVRSLLDGAIRWALTMNSAPSVDAGPDRTVAFGSPASLDGTVTDDDQLPAPPSLTLAWTKESGPGSVSFGSPGAADTTAAFSSPGAYYLRLTASDGDVSSSDLVRVGVTSTDPVANGAPSVAAGPDRTVRLPNTLALSAVVSDDGRPSPPGATTVAWSAVAMPAGGSVVFSAASNPSTTATFNLAGTYVLRITANDGALSSNDDVLVTVQATRTAALVYGGTADNQLRSRLEALGFTVEVRHQSASAAVPVTVAVIQGDTDSGVIGPKYVNRAYPVLVMDPNSFNTLDLTPSIGTVTSDTSVAVALPAHPLAAGLTGTRALLDSSPFMAVGVPTNKAIRVASPLSDASKWAVFAYEQGAQMATIQAPARRVGFFGDLQHATVDGGRLFDAAVLWLAGRQMPALLVTGSTTLTGADVALRDRLTANGLTVTTMTSSAVAESDAAGKALVVVAPSANSTQLGTKLISVNQPSLTALAAAFPGMGLATSSNYGVETGQSQVEIVTSTHPLAAGLTGVVATTTAADTYGWAVPSPLATIVAKTLAVGEPAHAAIFAYELGVALPTGGSTRDRRVGYYLGPNSAQNLTSGGAAMLDATIGWLLSGDADHDGLSLREEFQYGTDPYDADTNDDGILDGAAISAGLSATSTDIDSDGLSNAQERLNGTDPFRWDTDGDGYSDLADAFPLDPSRHALTATPGDTTPPTITLLEPTNAIPVP